MRHHQRSLMDRGGIDDAVVGVMTEYLHTSALDDQQHTNSPNLDGSASGWSSSVSQTAPKRMPPDGG
jgi:hypothetical protein